jgi:hypothetical protein
MADKNDIKVKVLRYKPHDGINFGEIELELDGQDMDISLVNSLRRVCEKNIPTLAFPKGLINIIKNTVVACDNDYMRQRLRFLPVFNNNLDIDPKLSYLPEKYWKDLSDEDYSDLIRPIHPNEKKIEILIDTYNDTKKIMVIDTNHPGFKVFVDNIKVDMYNKDYPCLIIRLRPGESFICSMRAVIGIGNEERNNQWNSCTRTHHYYEGQVEIPAVLCLRACATLDPYDICIRACDYMIMRSSLIKKIIQEKASGIESFSGLFEITLENDDSTMGEFLNSEFQKIPDIVSGVMVPDRLVKSVTLKQEMFGDKSLDKFNKIIDKVFGRAKSRLETLRSKIEKCRDKIDDKHDKRDKHDKHDKQSKKKKSSKK